MQPAYSKEFRTQDTANLNHKVRAMGKSTKLTKALLEGIQRRAQHTSLKDAQARLRFGDQVKKCLPDTSNSQKNSPGFLAAFEEHAWTQRYVLGLCNF